MSIQSTKKGWTVMRSPVEDRPRADDLADILKALGHHARLRIIASLCDADLSVIALSERLDVPQAIVSQQLRILRMRGLVSVRRDKGFARYSLARPRLRDLISCLEHCHSQKTGAPGARREGAGK
jgi:DNA-binding transcriptional ArsR family regulator